MAQVVSDNLLFETQFDPPPTPMGSVLIIACGALAREILAIINLNNWQHMDLTCLPAKYHLYPEKIVPAIENLVMNYRPKYTKIFIAYADCGTGGLLDKKCKELGVEMIKGPHCYSFFEGNEAFSKKQDDDEITAFYLTDFLVKQFDSFVWRPMGLDRHPELLSMYFGHYTKLVYQAQINDPDLDNKANEIALRMGLPLERRYTGYGDLERSLSDLA